MISASIAASPSRIRRSKAPGSGSNPPSISATVRAFGELGNGAMRAVSLANRRASAASSASTMAGASSTSFW